jgi:hypothetical protein
MVIKTLDSDSLEMLDSDSMSPDPQWVQYGTCLISPSQCTGLLVYVVIDPFTGFIRGILRGVRYAKSLRVLFLHRRSPSWTTLVLYSRVVFIFNEPTNY